jgi:hypothetical protein
MGASCCGHLQESRNVVKVNIVWTAVASAVLGLGALVAAGLGNTNAVLAFGLTSITSALLSTRE